MIFLVIKAKEKLRARGRHIGCFLVSFCRTTLQKEEQEKHRSSPFLHTFCMGGTFNIVYMFDFKKGL